MFRAKECLLKNRILHNPVSYTHLDVYKRQPLAKAILRIVTVWYIIKTVVESEKSEPIVGVCLNNRKNRIR